MSAEPGQQLMGLAVVDSEVDGEGIDELARQLREELLESDVDSVDFLRAGEAPPHTRAIDVVALGGLLVAIGDSVGALRTVLDTVRGWLSRRGRGSVKIQIDGDVLELSNVSTSQQDSIVEAFLSRHSASKQ